MTMQEVIENELKCVQRNCCRLENECAKCDLVLPKEEIINAYNDALKLEKENKELKELVEKYRQAVDKCLHITFMGGGCEVNTIGQYATLVDGYLTDVEGLAKWKN